MRSTSGCLPARTRAAQEAHAPSMRRSVCREPKPPTQTHRQIRVGEYHPVIVIRKVARSLMAAMPGWLLVIFGVCLAIPLARLVVLVLTAALCLMQPARVRRAASAWKGGKSHRRRDGSLGRDESLAGPLVSCPAPRDGQSGTDRK